MEYRTKEEVLNKANIILNKTLRDIILNDEEIRNIEEKIKLYDNKRKGYLGELVEWYVFGKKPDSRSEADFNVAGIELKTTPLKENKKNTYSAKERLVFSMIDYKTIITETWENSTFLKKNKFLLILFYLYVREEMILDYEFKFIKFLDLLNDISEEDIYQIKNDWEFIVNKIRTGQAHLLSEGDTFYLGACTKAKDSSVLREQSGVLQKAKPRAFSLKTTYLNYIIQNKVIYNNSATLAIKSKALTIEQKIRQQLSSLIGKSDVELAQEYKISKTDKSWRRRLIIQILTGKNVNEVDEIKKSNITLRVINIETNGSLKESISFPAFDFEEVVKEDWYLDLGNTIRMADLYSQLDENKFLFVVFQKNGKSSIFKGVIFWNFPQDKIDEAKKVWDETRRVLNAGDIVKKEVLMKSGKIKTFNNFPGLSYNDYLHVRPHGSTKEDMIKLPVKDIKTGNSEFTKQCFWLNAKYIAKVVSENLPNINKK